MQKEDDGFNNSEADGDPAAAFARVEDRLASVHGEVALLRAAIEGLTAARENIEIPDYEPTLERTEKILIALTQRIDPIAKSPLLRSEEHTSDLQSLMGTSYAVFCLKKKRKQHVRQDHNSKLVS